MNAAIQLIVHQYPVLCATALLSAIEMGCVVLMWVTFKTVLVRYYTCSYDCVLVVLYASIVTDDECVTGDVRLVGGVTNSSSGLLEVCANGGWGTVCDYWNEWSYENAVVVCRQLHLPTASQ